MPLGWAALRAQAADDRAESLAQAWDVRVALVGRYRSPDPLPLTACRGVPRGFGAERVVLHVIRVPLSGPLNGRGVVDGITGEPLAPVPAG